MCFKASVTCAQKHSSNVCLRWANLSRLLLSFGNKRCCTWWVWFVSPYRFRLSVGEIYNPPPLKASWFGTTLNVTDHPCEHSNRVNVSTGRVYDQLLTLVITNDMVMPWRFFLHHLKVDICGETTDCKYFGNPLILLILWCLSDWFIVSMPTLAFSPKHCWSIACP